MQEVGQFWKQCFLLMKNQFEENMMKQQPFWESLVGCVLQLQFGSSHFSVDPMLKKQKKKKITKAPTKLFSAVCLNGCVIEKGASFGVGGKEGTRKREGVGFEIGRAHV